jgi:hypothetical protein
VYCAVHAVNWELRGMNSVPTPCAHSVGLPMGECSGCGNPLSECIPLTFNGGAAFESFPSEDWRVLARQGVVRPGLFTPAPMLSGVG